MERYLEAVIPQLILVIININLIWEAPDRVLSIYKECCEAGHRK